jgi:hypothetical protein
MEGVSWRIGSWEVTKPTSIAQLKMEDACILYNVIKIKKKDQGKKMKVFCPFHAPNGIDTIM